MDASRMATKQRTVMPYNNFTISKINLPNILPQVFKYFSNENLLLNLNLSSAISFIVLAPFIIFYSHFRKIKYFKITNSF